MLIYNHLFHAVFIRQSSGRERKILEKSKKYSQKNVYVRIAYNSFKCSCFCVFVCACGLYACVYDDT